MSLSFVAGPGSLTSRPLGRGVCVLLKRVGFLLLGKLLVMFRLLRIVTVTTLLALMLCYLQAFSFMRGPYWCRFHTRWFPYQLWMHVLPWVLRWHATVELGRLTILIPFLITHPLD